MQREEPAAKSNVSSNMLFIL